MDLNQRHNSSVPEINVTVRVLAKQFDHRAQGFWSTKFAQGEGGQKTYAGLGIPEQAPYPALGGAHPALTNHLGNLTSNLRIGIIREVAEGFNQSLGSCGLPPSDLP